MSSDGDIWFVDDSPLVRPYAVTRGRTSGADRDVDMLTTVAIARPTQRLRRTEPEYLAIVALCNTPVTVAEVSATLKLPLAVTKILVGDLIAEGHLVFRAPAVTGNAPNELNILRAVLDGIRNL
ncbi:DUF742 domain-containing protein [Nocardia salmonicida]|uniref:DUF742 domain-containing protein n=1 Tax=Nocardia salmonicida TaxID=53431 RepID=UPI0033FA9D96